VESAGGQFLGWAACSPASKIRARVWSFDEQQRIDASFFIAALARSISARARFDIQSDSVRLVHGESDGLPGLIVDRYGDTLVAQFTSAGVDGWKLALDIEEGHKTGFYLDQRDSRKKFADHCRRLGLRQVLNCYCYTGGFTVAALAGGAEHVTSIDSSAPAIEKAARNVALNGFDTSRATFMDADVNASLRQYLDQGRSFDAIVLDPPKFAPTVTHAERAARAYKDINRLALKLLAPGGVLFTYSCSGGISADLFHKIVAGAASDAGVDGYITERMGGAPDHPMTLTFPEGEYLKGLVVMRK
jgi:23S rRNA (cytosine1962-C5)-methyltransferase